MNVKEMYVIWSFEHSQWWRAARSGYTDDWREAGHYGSEEAGEIVTDSVFLDEIAILKPIAEDKGAPRYHPYRGKE